MRPPWAGNAPPLWFTLGTQGLKRAEQRLQTPAKEGKVVVGVVILGVLGRKRHWEVVERASGMEGESKMRRGTEHPPIDDPVTTVEQRCLENPPLSLAMCM